ncbi:MAG: hypothetical protein GXO66_03610 [Euryarchaeota archaeon]|nr:hypothetical protein [Euryarchaeota archaeon]
MVSPLEGLTLWLVNTSLKTGIPLERFILLLAVNISLFLLLLLLLAKRLLRRGEEVGSPPAAGGDASGTLAELVEEK